MNTLDAAVEYFHELQNVEKISLAQLKSFCKSVKFVRLVKLKQSYCKMKDDEARMIVFMELLNYIDPR